MQWRLASFRSPDRLDPFLSILFSTPKGLQPVASFIVCVVVIAIGIPDQPWIHLIPLRLKRHLFSRKDPDRAPSFSLSIVLRTNGLPSASDKRVYMPATHDCLPKSLSLFNFQCQNVELTGVDFRTFEQFMVSVRAFRRLEDLTCTKVGWTTDPPERLVLLRTFAYPPLRRAMVQPFEVNGGFNKPHKPESHWVSALWCWARRRAVDGKHYLLEDHEATMAMKITSLFQGFWRRKSTPTLEMFVKERRRRDQHGEPLDVEGFDVCFAIDRRGYTVVFALTADRSLTTPPDEARIRDDYYALHVQCITICCTIATHSDLGLGNLVDHAKFWKQVMEFPFASLRNVVVAFARNTEGEVLRKTLQEHAPRLLNPGTRDTVARKFVIVQSDQDPPKEGCKWMKLDPATLETKGPSCAWYDENDSRSPDNTHGLSRILV
ncbi:hypothetical protein BC629DRAFT_1594216 [Irpex lacteus]|nr:hypothetical protein BC629DRAFT_1594216 [Irpex lacteus]